MPVAQADRAQRSAGDIKAPCSLTDVRVSLIGEPAAWLSVEKTHDAIVVAPRAPMPRRCTIRVAALFEQDRGFFEANTVMGRLMFLNGAEQSQTYTPFTRDPHRTLCELYLPVEASPDDDWPASTARWRNYQAIARRLLDKAGVPWAGLTPPEIDSLVTHMPYPEPLEGCILHALAQWIHAKGECVIEIGSFRGRSLTILALALREANSEAMLLSVDPHMEHRCNKDQVRLAMRQIGQEDRLVQFVCPADRAARTIRPGCASMVFVDGDHAYEQVLADFENYSNLLAPGGVMAFHDHDVSDHNGLPAINPGVRQVIERHVIPSGRFRPLLLAYSLFVFVKTD